MSPLREGVFKIEPQHLTEGLDAANYSMITGQDISTVCLSSFPHWEKVQHGDALSESEMKLRVEAIREVLPEDSKKSLSDIGYFPFFNRAKKDFTTEQALALSTTPIIYVVTKHIDNFPLVAKQLENIKGTRAKQTIFMADKTQRHFVYPYSFKPDDITEITVPDTAIMFDVPKTLSCKALWGHLTNLPEDLIAQCPDDNGVRLIAQLHEAYHAVQLDWAARKTVTGFDKELTADLFALRSIGACSKGKEARKAWVHARYLNMLCCSNRYWFAPLLDPPIQDDKAPSRFEIQEAVRCVRRGLYASHFGILQRSLFKAIPDIADGRYVNWMKTSLIPNPRASYSQLRKITEQGTFNKNPLANRIAYRILEAVESFSPKISTVGSNTLS